MPSRASLVALALTLTLAACAGGGRPDYARGWSGAGSMADVGATPEAPPPGLDLTRYDEVGYASWYGAEYAGGRTASGRKFNPRAITAAHRTLPLGSYAEVTALDTGRTVLVEITDRGPNKPGRILDLSQAAARLLAVEGAAQAPVRVRRVFPSGREQAALRRGDPAAARMDAPPVLLSVLRKRLPRSGTAPVQLASRGPEPRPVTRAPRLAQPDVSEPRQDAAARATPGFYIRVATFTNQDRAATLARQLGNGRLSPAGGMWQVQLGPYGDADSAEQARDEVAERGYGDARILRIP